MKPTDPKLAEHPIHLFFDEIRQGLKRRTAQWAAAKPIYLRQLLEFAERAYRRPLTATEQAQLEQFYETTCQQPDFGVEQAVRGVVTSILVSPYFCCRIDEPPGRRDRAAAVGHRARVAAELLPVVVHARRGTAGRWRKPASCATKRRSGDRPVGCCRIRRSARFALEFFGQWLRYRDFLEPRVGRPRSLSRVQRRSEAGDVRGADAAR